MSHNHHNDDHHLSTGNIRVAFFLNLGFAIIEIVGGLYVNSVAILSDALHDLGDSLSLGLSWYFQKLSNRGRDRTFSYGYKRFSVLGAIINSFVLVLGSVLIIMETVPRLLSPEQPKTEGMLLLAVLGILVNGAAVIRLKKGDSMNERVVSLHLLEDVLGWIAVLIGTLVMMFYDLPIIDPLLSLAIALYILLNVYKNLKQSFKIILQANPPELDEQKMKADILDIPHVLDVHDVHTWTMDGNYHVMSLHIVLRSQVSEQDQMAIKSKVRELIKACSIDHSTIEVDYEELPCELEDC